MEGDCTPYAQPTLIVLFQSTPSAWRETRTGTRRRTGTRHFNPLPPHGGRPLHSIDLRQVCNISIHSLRMEGDSCSHRVSHGISVFQSTPSAWRETTSEKTALLHTVFQSTPSAWRETGFRLRLCRLFCHISIHSLRMEGDAEMHVIGLFALCISIHSLRMEGDGTRKPDGRSGKEFQSTPSAWRETHS